MTDIEQLKELYMESSKHSNYQSVPFNLKKILPQEQITTESRYDEARLKYISSKIDFANKKILDIGGNTGFFTFEALRAGAEHVDYYEGNSTHAKFVKIASKVLKCEKDVTVFPEYYAFDQDKREYDIAFCLNVIHHLGDDFMSRTDMESAKKEMISCINNLADIADMMIFQMGFNWCGNRNQCLFQNGTKTEMKQFLSRGTAACWDIIACGVAERNNESIIYRDMDADNTIRIDSLGEFLNRPIFIMKSKSALK